MPVPLLHTCKITHRATSRHFCTSTNPARVLAEPLCGIFANNRPAAPRPRNHS
ncbi:MAG: hypothetical protein MSH49_06390 [[Eubacterium] saphenum]|nr:hypothetical protein [[Eubacterium] saphenum]